jgi:hypothetical protein
VIEYKTILTASGQTIMDIALQEYGRCDDVFLLNIDNPEVKSLNQVLAPGTKLKIRLNEGNQVSFQFEVTQTKINSGLIPPPSERRWIIILL